MMRLAWVIVVLAAVGAASVHLRLRQAEARAETQHLEGQRLKVRRTLWDQQLKLGELTIPQETRLKGRDTALDSGSPGNGRPTDRTVQGG